MDVAFRVDSNFEGSSAEGREVAQRETSNSRREGEGSVTSTWPMASRTSEDQSRAFEGECEEAGCRSGSRGCSHDCERDRRAISRGPNPEGMSVEGQTKRRRASSQCTVEGCTGVCRESSEAFGCTQCTMQSVLRTNWQREEARVQRLQLLVEAPPQVPPPPAKWGCPSKRASNKQ